MIKFGKAVPANVEQHLPELARALAEDPRLEALWLFGSRARGEADSLSDVDLAALARLDASPDELWDCQLAWTDIANRTLKTDEVAVQALNRMPVALRQSILRDARLLWARSPERTADFEAATLQRYLDMKPYLDRYDRELMQQAASGRLR
jgi:uncharacterized protein